MGEVGQDPASRRVGQSGKGAVQRPRRIFNHLVKYVAEYFRDAIKIFVNLFKVDQAEQEFAVRTTPLGEKMDQL